MSFVIKTVEDGVMKIVLNRPEAMNALNRDMMSGLSDALEEAAGNRDIGCVVVRGAGEKAFCAGGDVKSMAAGPANSRRLPSGSRTMNVRAPQGSFVRVCLKSTPADR